MRLAEVGEPLVVDADHLDGRLAVAHPRARGENAVQGLGLDAVAVLVAQPELRLAEPTDGPLAVLVETGRRHPVRAVDLPGHVLAPRRAHAVGEPEVGAL